MNLKPQKKNDSTALNNCKKKPLLPFRPGLLYGYKTGVFRDNFLAHLWRLFFVSRLQTWPKMSWKMISNHKKDSLNVSRLTFAGKNFRCWKFYRQKFLWTVTLTYQELVLQMLMKVQRAKSSNLWPTCSRYTAARARVTREPEPAPEPSGFFTNPHPNPSDFWRTRTRTRTQLLRTRTEPEPAFRTREPNRFQF